MINIGHLYNKTIIKNRFKKPKDNTQFKISDTKLLKKGIKLFGINAKKIQKRFFRDRTINEIENWIFWQEIKDESKMNKIVSSFVNNDIHNSRLTSTEKIDLDGDSEILPVEYYLSDFFK